MGQQISCASLGVLVALPYASFATLLHVAPAILVDVVVLFVSSLPPGGGFWIGSTTIAP